MFFDLCSADICVCEEKDKNDNVILFFWISADAAEKEKNGKILLKTDLSTW